MRMFLAGDHPLLEELRRQYETAQFASRELSGAGFFTRFSFPEPSTRLSVTHYFFMWDVSAEIPGIEQGVQFALFVQDGWIQCLEGWAHVGEWPESTDGFTLFYDQSPRRVEFLR